MSKLVEGWDFSKNEDRDFLSKKWMKLFKESRLNRIARTTSDHFTVVLETRNLIWGLHFCFSDICLNNKELVDFGGTKLKFSQRGRVGTCTGLV